MKKIYLCIKWLKLIIHLLHLGHLSLAVRFCSEVHQSAYGCDPRLSYQVNLHLNPRILHCSQLFFDSPFYFMHMFFCLLMLIFLYLVFSLKVKLSFYMQSSAILISIFAFFPDHIFLFLVLLFPSLQAFFALFLNQFLLFQFFVH